MTPDVPPGAPLTSLSARPFAELAQCACNMAHDLSLSARPSEELTQCGCNPSSVYSPTGSPVATSTTGARTALLGADFTSGGHAVAVVTPPVQFSQYGRASGKSLGGSCGHSSLLAKVVECGPSRMRHRAPFRKCYSANVVIARLDCACTGRCTRASLGTSFFPAGLLLRIVLSGRAGAVCRQRADRIYSE